MDSYKKLEDLGFNLSKMTKDEIEDLKNCHITISESEDFVLNNIKGQYDDASLKSSIEMPSNREQIVKVSNNSKIYKKEENDFRNNNETNKSNTNFYPSKTSEFNKQKRVQENKKEENSQQVKHSKTNSFKSNPNLNNKFSPNKKNILIENSNYVSNLTNEIDLSNIIIDNSEYVRLRNKDRSKLTLTEVYSIKLYEKIDETNKELNEAKKQYYQFRQEKLSLEEENSLLKLEKEKLTSINKSNTEWLNVKIMNLETENIRLTELCNSQEKKLQESFPKITRYEEQYNQVSKLTKELDESRDQNSKLIEQNNSLTKEKNDLVGKSQNIKFEKECLEKDKSYLNKEVLIKDERIATLNNKIKSLEEELSETRKTNNRYIEKLTDKSSSIEIIYQDKLKNELSEIKSKYNNDLENLKKMYEDLNNTRSGFLIEERNELKIKLSKLEGDLKEKNSSLDFINSEFSKYKNAYQEEMSTLKIQFKIKSEDYDRLSNLYDENLNILKIIKAENESLKEKHDIFRTELINKESYYKEELSNYRAENIILKESNSNYEKMENELDDLIVDSTMNDV